MGRIATPVKLVVFFQVLILQITLASKWGLHSSSRVAIHIEFITDQYIFSLIIFRRKTIFFYICLRSKYEMNEYQNANVHYELIGHHMFQASDLRMLVKQEVSEIEKIPICHT